MRITVEIKDGRLYLPIRSEVEEIALGAFGHYNTTTALIQIYFDIIPLGYRLDLLYDKNLGGWEIRRN